MRKFVGKNISCISGQARHVSWASKKEMERQREGERENKEDSIKRDGGEEAKEMLKKAQVMQQQEG